MSVMFARFAIPKVSIAILALAIGNAQAAQRNDTSATVVAANGLNGATLFIVRHAEKTGFGDGLSPAGEMRAEAYAQYLEHLKFGGNVIRITTLVAARDNSKSNRPRLTLTPLSMFTGLPIMQPCTDKDVTCQVAWLRAQPQNETTVISWRHTQIESLLEALGVKSGDLVPNGVWPSDRFDWVIAVRFDPTGRYDAQRSRLLHEPLSVDDVAWAAMDHPTIRPWSAATASQPRSVPSAMSMYRSRNDAPL